MRYFQTCLLPEGLLTKYNLSFAAANFSNNLISGGCFDRVFSILPLHIRGRIEQNHAHGYDLIYSRLRQIPGITILANMSEQINIFRQIKRGDSLWVYNVNMLNALLLLLLKLFKPSVSVNAIILDYTPVNKPSIKESFLLWLINNMNGNIRLAYSDLFVCKNAIVLPGVVPADAGDEPLIRKLNNRFLLSGAINENIAQISMLLDTFSQLPNCELHITGMAEDEAKIKVYASKYRNIIYHGKVAFSDYLSIMHSCTFQLSTRNPELLENQCNFPSKIIETLLHNRVIISTIEYKQLKGVNYFYVPSEANAFMQHIQQIMHLQEDKLMTYANQGQRIKEMFSTEVWNNAITNIERNGK